MHNTRKMGRRLWKALLMIACLLSLAALGLSLVVIAAGGKQIYAQQSHLFPLIQSYISITTTETPSSTLLPQSTASTEFRTITFTSSPTITQTATQKRTLTKTPKPPTATRRPTKTRTQTRTPTDTLSPTDTKPPTPTSNTPTPPPAAAVHGILGHWQSSSLDCESRSAADLAGFFKLQIDHMDFQIHLPKSDDPDEGFVGNYWGMEGQIPPHSYGVYAQPVAKLLRSYGLNAKAKKGFTWVGVQEEIASGKPVMVWVINNTLPGKAVNYTATNHHTTLVAPFEHTVLVIAYTSKYVTLLDGAMVYQRTIEQFTNSWGVLGNMAVIVSNPPLLK